MQFDGAEFGREIVAAVKAHVASLIDPLVRRLEVLEARQLERGERGEKGEPGDAGPQGPQGERGDRGEAGPQGERGDIGERGPPGRDAEPWTVEQVRGALLAMPGLFENAVSDYLMMHPPAPGPQGERGERGEPGATGERGERGEKGDRGDDGRAGADGVGLAGALLDREGRLVVTMTNGHAVALGAVVGRDGKDGQPGPAGRDGFSIDHFNAELKADGRTLRLSLMAGENEEAREFVLPMLIDRGVWAERPETEPPYHRGDTVTWGGSMWIAQRETRAKPETSDDWRLAVKRGRDGKDGKAGPSGPKGDKGDPGRNGSSF